MKDKHKVLLVGPSSPHLANHYKRINTDQFNIHIITNNREYFGDDVECEIVDFTLKSARSFFKTPKKIRKKINAFQPDVIHVHQANSVGFYTIRALKNLKIPVILSAWGSDILINPAQSKLLKWIVKYILKRVTFCTSDSVFMADEMQALVPETTLDITICNFGVTEKNVKIAKQNIIYSNRNHNPLYRINKVINAFHTFLNNRENKSWQLLIAGRGSETEKLKIQVKELGLEENVEFVGFVNEDENIANYAKAKFFISLPESDATAVSLLEAMYYKCVPILSNLPANKEWVKNKENGVIAQNLEEDIIAQALKIDLENAGNLNHNRIKKEGTVAVSETRFRELLIKAINK